MVQLIEIDQEHWRYGFELEENQKSHVADEKGILARAFAYRSWRSQCYAIYVTGDKELEKVILQLPEKYRENCSEEGVPVGLLLFYDDPEDDMYVFSQLLVDRHFQHRGFGKEALGKALAIMEEEKRFPQIALCVTEGNPIARKLYEKYGFRMTDDPENERTGEYVFVKKIR